MRMKLSSLFLSLVLCVASAVATGAEPRTITLDDLGKVRSVGTPVLSRDGRRVAYAFEDRIYVVPVRGGEARAVTSEASAAREPQWSKDGSHLFFLSDRSGSDQLWKLPLEAFGEAVKVTEAKRGVSSLRLSPDESRLLLSYDDEAGESPGGADENNDGEKNNGEKDNGEGEGERKEPWVITRLQFKEDAGDGYLTGPETEHLYTLDLASGALTQISGGRYAEVEAAWSPDGERVVFVSSRVEDPDVGYGNNLWLASATPDGAPEAFEPRALTTGDEVKSSPAFSPDGRHVAYLSAVDGVYGISRLVIVPVEGGEPRMLTAELDRWVSEFRFSEDGRSIWFLYDNHGGRHLGRVRLRDGQLTRVLEGDLAVTGFDVDASGNAVVRLNRENDAADLYRLRGDRLERLTDANRDFFADLALGSKEKITYTSTDDTLVEAFVVKPPGFEDGRRYPVILDIHGGPVGQFSWGYDFGAQYMAANGYVVVQPNPRGSTGRGQAFIRAIQDTWGITDYPDVVGAVDRVIELGYGDPEALAVTGYSYGGYMTNVVITRTDRFKAAASGAGHSYIAANYGHDIYQRWYNWELGPPWNNREKYDRLSPLLAAGEVTTPTIFLGGREDWNVPVLNAELFYQSLRHQGVDTQLVVYPDSHHGGWEERFDKDYLQRIVGWFDRYVKGGGGPG